MPFILQNIDKLKTTRLKYTIINNWAGKILKSW